MMKGQRQGANGRVIDADRKMANRDGRLVRWSKGLKQDFLSELAATCCVRIAADSVGLEMSSIYKLRHRDAEFAAGWERALALGYVMLETHLVGAALNPGPADAQGRRPLPPGSAAEAGIDVPLALQLLTKHREALLKTPRAPRGGVRHKRFTLAEIDAALLKAIAGRERGAAAARCIEQPRLPRPAGGEARDTPMVPR